VYIGLHVVIMVRKVEEEEAFKKNLFLWSLNY